MLLGRGVAKLCLVVLVLAAFAATFCLILLWIGLFWLQAHLLLLLSAFLSSCFELPSTQEDNSPGDDDIAGIGGIANNSSEPK